MTIKTLIKDIALTSAGVSAFTLIALSPVLAYADDTGTKYGSAYAQSTTDSATISQGSFTGRSEHVTSGEVSIVKTATGYDLILADNFFLDGAPDPVIGFGNNDKYDTSATFTKLEKKNGRQTYSLPEGFALNTYSQVFIWCGDFSVPLGIANLQTNP